MCFLETLSIIAYKQPVTKAEIEKIRGVSSEHAVSKLVEYNLVQELGRLDAPGKAAFVWYHRGISKELWGFVYRRVAGTKPCAG